MQTIRIIITGKVQGVFFRANAKEMATKYEIKGWIKNTNDGKVEAMVYGQENKVKDFLEWCKTGPEKAEVDNVIVHELPEIKFNNFEVIR